MHNINWKKYGIEILSIILLTLVIECLVFNFHALFQSSKEVVFDLDSQEVTPVTELTYVPLTDEELETLEYEENINKQLAELNGTEYEETENTSIVEYEGELCHKIYNFSMTFDLSEAQYIQKATLQYAADSDIGYNVTLLCNGEEVNSIYATFYSKLGVDTSNISGTADQIQLRLTTTSEYQREGASLTVSNPFRINLYRVMFLMTAFFLLLLLVEYKEWMVKKPEWVFSIFSLLLSICMLTIVGTNQSSWDEQIHWQRAHDNSFLSTITTTEVEMNMNGLLTPSFNTFEDKQAVASYAEATNDYTKADISYKQRFVSYSVRAYLPQSVMLFIGRTLHLPFTVIFAMGKLGNLIFYTILMFFAIRITKIGKPILAAIGLLPTPLFLASTYSYDAFVTGFLVLGFVLWLNEILEPEKKLKWYTALIMMGCFIIGSWSKLPYILMMLLLCFLPKKKFSGRVQEIIFKIIIVMLVALTLRLIVQAPDTAGYEATQSVADDINNAGDKRTEGANFMGQIYYILGNPLTYTWILLRSLVRSFYGYCFGTQVWLLYAYVGHFATVFVALPTILLLGTGGIATSKERGYHLFLRYKILLGIMVFGMMSIVWTSMYASYTAVGATHIKGVQARYYIPFLMPLFLLLRSRKRNEKLQGKIRDVWYYRAVFGIVWFLSVYGIYVYMLKPMCF